jgi:endonuclease/exonuclease/phosphatase family metal-dependent hydrolase
LRLSRSLAVALFALVTGLGTPAAGAPPRTLTILQWNVAGQALHRGSTALVGPLAAAVRGADLVSLNEICAGQWRALVARLRATGWPQDPGNFSRFESQGRLCKGGTEAFGVAILSRAPLGTAQRFQLADDGRVERRRLLCVPVRTVRFCTTHLTPFDARVNRRQLADVRRRIDAFQRTGDAVILAGDLNVEPPRLAAWGRYTELDDRDGSCPGRGESTGASGDRCGGKKLDYILVHRDFVSRYDADAAPVPGTCAGPCSDHRPLYGRVLLRPAAARAAVS